MAEIVRRPRSSLFPDLFDWFDAAFPPLQSWPSWPIPGMFHSLRIEDYMEDGTYVLRIEMPGIDPDKDVEINVDNGVLSITAERSEEEREKNRSEFRYGKFARSITLPSGADEEKIEADYKDGILTVRIPVGEAGEKARRIPVRRSS